MNSDNDNVVGGVYRDGNDYMLFTKWLNPDNFSSGGQQEEKKPETPTPAPTVSVMPTKPSKRADKDKKQGVPAWVLIGAAVLVSAVAVVVIIKNVGPGKKPNTQSNINQPNPPAGRRLYLRCRGGYQDGRVFPPAGDGQDRPQPGQ